MSRMLTNTKIWRIFSFNKTHIVYNPRYTTTTRCLNQQLQDEDYESSRHKVKPFHEIPGRHPKLWPLSVAEIFVPRGGFSKNFLKVNAKLNQTYGPIFRQKLNPIEENIGILDPKDVEILFRSELKYPQRTDIKILEKVRKDLNKPAGVFFADGEEWYKHRSVISKRMLRPREVNGYCETLNEIITDFITRIREVRVKPGDVKEYEIVDLDNELFLWSFEGVSHVVFDRRFGALQEPMADPRAQEFILSVQKFLGNLAQVSIMPMELHEYYETEVYKTFMDGITKMYYYVELFLKEKIESLREENRLDGNITTSDGRADFLRFLLSSKKLTVDDLIGSVIDLMFAGVDTTSNSFHWCLYLLGRNPEKLSNLENEIFTVLKPGEVASPDTLQNMPYLRAVIKETLRMYPLVYVLPRVIQEDIVLSGYNVPKGTQVIVHFFQMARDPKLFPEPDKFLPERWLRKAFAKKAEFSSLPFGFGVRMCVGRRLAELEMHLLLARMVQEFRIKYPSNEEIDVKLRGLPIPERNVRIKLFDR